MRTLQLPSLRTTVGAGRHSAEIEFCRISKTRAGMRDVRKELLHAR